MTHNNKAKFIVIEGLEGAGKTTAITHIVDTLKQLGVTDILHTREPGGTKVAEQLRAILKQEHEENISDATECLMMYAARVQLMDHVIKPALAQGTWVVGDRHDLSSRAYQGGGRQLTGLVDTISDAVMGDFKPDLTFYLDIDPQQGLERVRKRGALDRIEKENIAFFERARTRYQQLAQEDERIISIDATQSKAQVRAQITHHMQEIMTTWL